jgi:hypothetical protein
MGPSVVSSGSTFQLARPGDLETTAAVFVDCALRLAPDVSTHGSFDRLKEVARGERLEGASDQHEAVCAFLDCLKAATLVRGVAPEAYTFVSKCAEYDRYLDQKAVEYRANAREDWSQRSVTSDSNPVLAQVVDEIASHVRAFSDPAHHHQSLLAYSRARIKTLMPAEIAEMRQEANIELILPFLERALAVPGDMAEFGCFRGVLSIKLAWLAKAMGADKHYYAFDTFHGFEITDPAGGALGIGAFQDNANAYEVLRQWSRVLDLTPIKGDATQTCARLRGPLSFVWLDLDMDVLMDPVLRQIWPLCGPESLIGIDDVGRPETPTVGPWLDRLVAAGALEIIFDSDKIASNTFIRFARKTGDFPPPSLGDQR